MHVSHWLYRARLGLGLMKELSFCSQKQKKVLLPGSCVSVPGQDVVVQS